MGVAIVRSQVDRPMQALISIYWDLVIFRRGPRDVPPSPALLLFVAVLYIAIGTLQSRLMFGAALAPVRAVADFALTCTLFGAALFLRGRQHRLVQTLNAILGTGALLSLPMLALQIAHEGLTEQDPLSLLLSVLSLPLLVWYLFVIGNITKLALEVSLLAGMALAMSYVLLGYVLISPWSGAAT